MLTYPTRQAVTPFPYCYDLPPSLVPQTHHLNYAHVGAGSGDDNLLHVGKALELGWTTTRFHAVVVCKRLRHRSVTPATVTAARESR